jgi:1-acyl-sn-glycerol-3-phosphate acyltransferase
LESVSSAGKDTANRPKYKGGAYLWRCMVNLLLKPVRLLYCLYALLLFIAGMLCVLPFVAIFSLQGSKKGGDRIYRVCRWWDSAWLILVGIRVGIHNESAIDPAQQYVFVSNHISYLDIPMILQAVTRDSVRILGKAETARIPLFGFIYRRAVVMVDRSNAQDRSRSVRDLKSALADAVSVFIFPEGTFNETGSALKDFYDGAFRIAIEMQTPVQPILFLDTFDRMHYSSIFSLCPGRTRAVFLAPVEVAGMMPQDMPELKARVYHMMEEGLKRYAAAWIKH